MSELICLGGGAYPVKDGDCRGQVNLFSLIFSSFSHLGYFFRFFGASWSESAFGSDLFSMFERFGGEDLEMTFG